MWLSGKQHSGRGIHSREALPEESVPLAGTGTVKMLEGAVEDDIRKVMRAKSCRALEVLIWSRLLVQMKSWTGLFLQDHSTLAAGLRRECRWPQTETEGTIIWLLGLSW